MREYGFQAVRASARSAEDFVTENRFARAMSRSMFAVVGSVPALKRRMFAEHGES